MAYKKKSDITGANSQYQRGRIVKTTRFDAAQAMQGKIAVFRL